MSILTTISGIPLYSTPQEAIAWATANNKQGMHTHIYNGQTGYMGGATHGQAATSSQGLNGSNNLNNNSNNNTNNNSNY
tara:strand:+ start:198 stop:434 length:237 start_codon:yes stop_codon:yes gene_type:complete